jgi:multimeric flavodoxin WrbA
MKAVAFNGSGRKDGNTAILLRGALEELEKAGLETELVQLAGRPLRGCTACFQCYARKDGACALGGDEMNSHIRKMVEADAILIGSPTYFADVTAETKALIDRAGMVTRANGDQLRRKVGAAVVSVRRAGAIHAFDTINHFFLIGQMIVAGSTYWNIGIGREPGQVEGDEEGVATLANLGRNVAWVVKALAAGGAPE